MTAIRNEITQGSALPCVKLKTLKKGQFFRYRGCLGPGDLHMVADANDPRCQTWVYDKIVVVRLDDGFMEKMHMDADVIPLKPGETFSVVAG